MESVPLPTAATPSLLEHPRLRGRRHGSDHRTTGLVVMANRLPVSAGPNVDDAAALNEGDGWRQSPGGLVSALVPVLQKENGSWVGWSGVAELDVEPFALEGVANVPVRLARAEVEAYYDGFCNQVLWPLFHGLLPREFRPDWWRCYRAVNARFARAASQALAAAENRGDGTDLVWIHDYQLLLAPAALRERRRDARIGFFLHIPFPSAQEFARLPWREELLAGILGSDLVGFQTRQDAESFVQTCLRYARGVELEPASDGDGAVLRWNGRPVRVGAFPISIDTERIVRIARDPETANRAAALRRALGAGGRQVILGVDRLDYTKGIDLRLEAFSDLLRSRRSSIDDCVLLQSVVPTREGVEEYRELRARVEELVGQINGEHAQPGRVAVHYARRQFGLEDLVALYRAADVLVVTPLRDGMNLVAKEFVASRVAEPGVLVLSEFAGAAVELEEALLVNPYDREALVEALARALDMPAEERASRMQALRDRVASYTVYDWSEAFLDRLRGTRAPRVAEVGVIAR